jgi:signal transduction histidine kinase
MVNELLDYSRGRPALTLEPLRIHDLFSELEQLNADYLRLRGIACSFSPIDASINADRDRLVRTLQNLLNNAVESFGDKKGKIAFSAQLADAKTLEIRVADNGPGIPEAIRDRLFEPFVTAAKKGGTGLGLAIAQTVIEAHGGSISCSPRDGGGAAFTILLPRL